MIVYLKELDAKNNTLIHISEWSLEKHHKNEIHKLLEMMFDNQYSKVKSNPMVVN